MTMQLPSGTRSPAAMAWRSHAMQWSQGKQLAHSAQMRGKELELSILNFIGEDWYGEGITSRWLKRTLDANKDVSFIRILLNSPGGDYFEGVAIHNLLKRHSATVIVEIIGEAASAASVIALAGDEIILHQGAMLMIHEAWSWGAGTASDFESIASMLRGVNGEAVGIYAQRTGLEKGAIEDMVAKTTWIGAEQALAEKWVDEVIPANAAAPKTGADIEQAKQPTSTGTAPSPGAKQSSPLIQPFAAAETAAAFRALR